MSVERFKYLIAHNYMSRLTFYCVVVGVASIGGSYFTRLNDYWAQASVRDAFFFGAFSLGPALLIVAVARLSPLMMSIVALIAAAGILVMWWLFANNDSSTSALVFASGLFAGIPPAIIIVVVSIKVAEAKAP